MLSHLMRVKSPTFDTKSQTMTGSMLKYSCSEKGKRPIKLF